MLELPEPRPADALAQIDLAESDPAMAGSTLDLGVAKTLRGRAHLQLGQVDEAAEHAAGALQMLGPSAHVDRVSALLLLGDVGTAQLHLELAHEAYGEARDVLTRMMPTRRVARLWRELADSLRSYGDHHGAITAYDQALRLVGMAPRPEIARDLTALGRGTYTVS